MFSQVCVILSTWGWGSLPLPRMPHWSEWGMGVWSGGCLVRGVGGGWLLPRSVRILQECILVIRLNIFWVKIQKKKKNKTTKQTKKQNRKQKTKTTVLLYPDS